MTLQAAAITKTFAAKLRVTNTPRVTNLSSSAYPQAPSSRLGAQRGRGAVENFAPTECHLLDVDPSTLTDPDFVVRLKIEAALARPRLLSEHAGNIRRDTGYLDG